MIESGVMQGDPLAGILFVFILDPVLYLLYNTFEGPGHGYCRACADDIGVVLKDLSGLRPLSEAFNIIKQATALTSNIPKCILIPLNDTLTYDFLYMWLRSNTPSSDSMHVDIFGEYLGILLGPAVGNQSFDKL